MTLIAETHACIHGRELVHVHIHTTLSTMQLEAGYNQNISPDQKLLIFSHVRTLRQLRSVLELKVCSCKISFLRAIRQNPMLTARTRSHPRPELDRQVANGPINVHLVRLQRLSSSANRSHGHTCSCPVSDSIRLRNSGGHGSARLLPLY